MNPAIFKTRTISKGARLQTLRESRREIAHYSTSLGCVRTARENEKARARGAEAFGPSYARTSTQAETPTARYSN
jgi:hypothetical protein